MWWRLFEIDIRSFLERKKPKMEMLQTYGTDMTLLAEKGRLDPVIGRDKEMENLTQTLLKRRKSNACLVGDAGVGKTAIVEALAIKIVQGSVPPKLLGKKIFSIDMTRLVAGAMHRGDFEKRINELLEEVREGEVILFIDELHTLVKNREYDQYNSSPDAANILKPALARDDFKCIGATTLVEYKRHIEKDPALKRRFETIQVDEPSRDDSIRIIEGIIHKYQYHHGVKYTHNAIVSAVNLSKRYIRPVMYPFIHDNERFLPDKAIDLIDKTGARVQMQGETVVTEAEIEDTVSACTGVPVSSRNNESARHLVEMEANLRRNIVGQDEAVMAVCCSIRRARAGIRDATKPIGSFLFVGPTGVGKTEMAKALARFYFGSEEAMVRLDMSEFMEYHTVSRLIGSPIGYRDSEEGGQLTEAVRQRPHSLVLFDEIEKAHGKVLNLLLQILDDGRLSDGRGNRVDFTNTIVILTSNIALFDDQRLLEEEELMMMDPYDYNKFRPELMNRFQNIVSFKALEKEHIQKILELMVEKLRATVGEEKKIRVDISKNLKESLGVAGYDRIYGARMLKRVFTTYVETKLADEILFGRVVEGDNILMDITFPNHIVCKKL